MAGQERTFRCSLTWSVVSCGIHGKRSTTPDLEQYCFNSWPGSNDCAILQHWHHHDVTVSILNSFLRRKFWCQCVSFKVLLPSDLWSYPATHLFPSDVPSPSRLLSKRLRLHTIHHCVELLRFSLALCSVEPVFTRWAPTCATRPVLFRETGSPAKSPSTQTVIFRNRVAARGFPTRFRASRFSG